MSTYDIVIISEHLSRMGEHVKKFFEAHHCSKPEEAEGLMSTVNCRAIVLDVMTGEQLDFDVCRDILGRPLLTHLPLVVLSPSVDIQDKLTAFEIGCDDFIDSRTHSDEVCARITKSIFNRIAQNQLNQRLEMATDTAKNALVDNSDLGANIQFLLAVHSCDNLDQLGQQFFSTIERYGLSCSLQIRSDDIGVKNMEAHGMAKDLESQLLMQLKDSNRFIDFGARTIINFDRVSILIKNMPVDDLEKYGAIKDNVFCLVQGLNARVVALEDRCKLLHEKESLRKLSSDIHNVTARLQMSYEYVVKQILVEVENAVEMIQNRLPSLSLTENDENFLDDVTEHLLRETTNIFSEGLKVDEMFSGLSKNVNRSLELLDNESEASIEILSANTSGRNQDGSPPVELF